jgi:hypothetical protein
MLIVFHILFFHIPSRYSRQFYFRVESLFREVALHDLTTKRRIEEKAISPEPQGQPYFLCFLVFHYISVYRCQHLPCNV